MNYFIDSLLLRCVELTSADISNTGTLGDISYFTYNKCRQLLIHKYYARGPCPEKMFEG